MLLSTLSCNQKQRGTRCLPTDFALVLPLPPFARCRIACLLGVQASRLRAGNGPRHWLTTPAKLSTSSPISSFPLLLVLYKAHRRAQHPLACESSPPRRVSYRSSRRCRRLRRALHNYSTLVSLPRSPEPVGPRQSGRRHRLSRVPPAAATLPYGRRGFRGQI